MFPNPSTRGLISFEYSLLPCATIYFFGFPLCRDPSHLLCGWRVGDGGKYIKLAYFVLAEFLSKYGVHSPTEQKYDLFQILTSASQFLVPGGRF